jgi:oligopeptide/dipeptide ABC transporter ATP-binding protein
MLTEGVNTFYETPAAAIGPAAFIAGAALAFGFSGEALAQALNPLLWTRAASGTAAAVAAPTEAPAPDLAPTFPSSRGAASSNGRSAEAPVALEVRDLTVTFPGSDGPLEIIRGVSFSVREGEVLGIVGESGSGKTMTCLAIAQLVPYPGTTGGTVALKGEVLGNLSEGRLDSVLGTSMAVVFQDPSASLNPALKIGEQLTEGVRRHRHLNQRAAIDLAIEKLREVNIPAARLQLQKHPHQLSGGMRQRVMIAMGLMNEIQLLLADEPTTALDVTIQAQIMDVLARINETHGTAIVLVSHNLGLVKQNCDRVIVMYAGRIVEELPTDRLTVDPLHPYTRALIAAVPSLTRSPDEPLAYIPGQAPDLADPPPGCPFHPRCPLAMDVCREQMPALVNRPGGRRVACWAVEKVEA